MFGRPIHDISTPSSHAHRKPHQLQVSSIHRTGRTRNFYRTGHSCRRNDRKRKWHNTLSSLTISDRFECRNGSRRKKVPSNLSICNPCMHITIVIVRESTNRTRCAVPFDEIRFLPFWILIKWQRSPYDLYAPLRLALFPQWFGRWCWRRWPRRGLWWRLAMVMVAVVDCLAVGATNTPNHLPHYSRIRRNLS